MGLWLEAFNALEVLSDLIKSKKFNKPSLIPLYYENVAQAFWKTGNLLMHSATLFKLFQILRDQKKNMKGKYLISSHCNSLI